MFCFRKHRDYVKTIHAYAQLLLPIICTISTSLGNNIFSNILRGS